MVTRTTGKRGRLAKRIAIIAALVLVLLYVVGGLHPLQLDLLPGIRAK
jgi:hypothetical protein